MNRAELEQANRKWCERDREETSIVSYDGCGCQGNCECGHEPLDTPKQCELDIGDEGESGRCYCCRAVERRAK